MFGKIKLGQFNSIVMPQKAQSAWDGVGFDEIVGAEYKPVLFIGEQQVQGINYVYYAEQRLLDSGASRRLVRLVINEYAGQYELLKESIEVLES